MKLYEKYKILKQKDDLKKYLFKVGSFYIFLADDAKAIAKANGVGAKTAARIILELQDKLMKETPADVLSGKASSQTPTRVVVPKGVMSEAQDALMVLGYTRSEASSALQNIDMTIGLEETIKQALKKLMR